jgi:hypothetical protein
MMYIGNMEKQLYLASRFHDEKAYNIKTWRARKINDANLLRSRGFSFAQIGRLMNTSATTARRYYYGFADHCLYADASTPAEYRTWHTRSLDERYVMYLGASCPVDLGRK